MNLAAIHIRAKEAGLDREAYCALLFRIAGVRSAKELDEEQYKAVMRELRSVINAKKAPRETRKKTPAEAKLWAVWYNELCPLLQPHQRNVHYLAGIIERRLARRVLDGERLLTALLDPSELHTAIEALKSAANSRKYASRPRAGHACRRRRSLPRPPIRRFSTNTEMTCRPIPSLPMSRFNAEEAAMK